MGQGSSETQVRRSWWGSEQKESTSRKGSQAANKAPTREKEDKAGPTRPLPGTVLLLCAWSYAARSGSLPACKLLERCRGGNGQRVPLSQPSTLVWPLRAALLAATLEAMCSRPHGRAPNCL